MVMQPDVNLMHIFSEAVYLYLSCAFVLLLIRREDSLVLHV